MTALRFDILTLFPELCRAVLSESIPRIAQEQGAVEYHYHNFRDFAEGVHQAVDDRPYGGGAGMVLKPEPIFRCIRSVISKAGSTQPKMLLLTPQGRRFDQKLAGELAREPWLLLLCGRYEGFDERIRQGWPWLEVSIGDFVVSGGELPALVVVDAVTRLLPGVLGDDASSHEESFGQGLGGLLEYPQYTRPVEFEGMKVPEVLQSGHHGEIQKWRLAQALERTKQRRPDLLDDATSGQQNKPGA